MNVPSSSPRILKVDEARNLAAQSNFNFQDIREKCEAFLAQTRQKAEEVIVNAQQEAELLRAKAIEEGREEGKQLGLQDAKKQVEIEANQIAETRVQQELEKTIPALNEAAQQLRQEQQNCLVRWEEDGIGLAIAIAEKIIRKKINTQPELIIERVIDLLSLTVGNTNIQIHLHPNDAEIITNAGIVVSNLSGNENASTNRQIIPDETLLPGDCKIRTTHGMLDATIVEQLNQIANELIQ